VGAVVTHPLPSAGGRDDPRGGGDAVIPARAPLDAAALLEQVTTDRVVTDGFSITEPVHLDTLERQVRALLGA
jgi:hypothetical protein